jgi:hypothetical protein
MYCKVGRGDIDDVTNAPYHSLPFESEPQTRAVAAEAREEWRADEEAAAREAAVAWNHGRTIADLARDCMARGDRISVTTYNHRAVGFVVEVADDLIAIRNVGSARIDFHLTPLSPFSFTVNEPAIGDAQIPPVSSGGFHGRLLSREASGDDCLVAVVGEAEPLCGRIEVGANFVRVIAKLGGETIVRTESVLSLAPRD